MLVEKIVVSKDREIQITIALDLLGITAAQANAVNIQPVRIYTPLGGLPPLGDFGHRKQHRVRPYPCVFLRVTISTGMLIYISWSPRSVN